MNCFHFWVSLGYNTIELNRYAFVNKLWIAFIFEYLWDTTQSEGATEQEKPSCELLSFLSIFGIQHNFLCVDYFLHMVVNCFHFWVSLGYNTIARNSLLLFLPLWIAFIFEYLWDITQPPRDLGITTSGCELLSFLSIFEI